jgi:hypothetical protein
MRRGGTADGVNSMQRKKRGGAGGAYSFLLWRKPYNFLWLLRSLIGLVPRLALESLWA